WYGGSALPEMYRAISDGLGRNERREGGAISEENILDDYVDAVRAQLDIAGIRNARIAILHDPIHGVSSALPSRILGVDDMGSAAKRAAASASGSSCPSATASSRG